jgi:hypothetical protein|tara:strand:- start:70 stop:339 length:270 start_codon:yes stop_codon:yes gene_type:complete
MTEPVVDLERARLEAEYREIIIKQYQDSMLNEMASMVECFGGSDEFTQLVDDLSTHLDIERREAANLLYPVSRELKVFIDQKVKALING